MERVVRAQLNDNPSPEISRRRYDRRAYWSRRREFARDLRERLRRGRFGDEMSEKILREGGK